MSCRDDRRGGAHEHTQLDVPGSTSRARPRKERRRGGSFLGVTPASSDAARKRLGQEVRHRRLRLRSGRGLTDLARSINAVVRGGIPDDGRSFPSRAPPLLDRINASLVRWARRTDKRLRRPRERAWRSLTAVAMREPTLFAHGQHGARPRAG